MTDQDPRHVALTRRLALVVDVSALNAEALRLTQALAGIEMEVLRIELDMRKTSSTGQLVQDLHEAHEKAGTIQTARAECEERIVATEQEIEKVDHLLAGMNSG